MSTSYFIRRLSIVNDNKDKLKDLIDKSTNGEHFEEILELTSKMYGCVDKYNLDSNVLRIGHQAGGWKFLWVPNCWECDNGHYDVENKIWVSNLEFKKTYDLSKDGITNFVMDHDNVVVDEYGKILDKKEFLEMAFNWCTDGVDIDDYYEANPTLLKFDMSSFQTMWKKYGYEFKSIYSDAFYSDGLRFCIYDIV